MPLELQDGRWSMLWRYHDRSMEIATQLLAFSRMAVRDRGVFWHLKIRWNIQIENLMHDFCYAVRKGIELTAKVHPEISDLAKTCFPHEEGGFVKILGEGRIQLCDRSFWWIVNRIIHSRDTFVKDQTIQEYVSPEPPHYITNTFSPKFFGFFSDLDQDKEFRYVETEELLQCYLG